MVAHTPSIWPTLGWVTSGFGFRTNPFTGLTQMHEGLDISNRVGTPIIAPADGIISDIGNDRVHGRILVISHGFGMTSRFSHLEQGFGEERPEGKTGREDCRGGDERKNDGPPSPL